ncbi:MAG TPA: response regulator transcription factor [Solirubrobacteraceae bacterium]|nr:response regulator transcription factor [Solirubrobacteraceae bacterium]
MVGSTPAVVSVGSIADENTTTLQRSPTPAATTLTHIRVLVVDDHPAVRRGVQALIDSEPEMRVVGEVRTAEEALAKLTDSIDVAVIDCHLGDGRDGLSLTADFKAPEHGPRVLIYSAFADLGSAVSALIAGADGQDQAIFGMLIDGIDSEVIAERLGITQQDLQHRRW